MRTVGGELAVHTIDHAHTYTHLYRNTPHSTTKKTPASLILEQLPATRFSLLKPNFGQHNRAYQEDSAWPSRKLSPDDSMIVLNARNGTGPKWLHATVMRRVELGSTSCIQCTGGDHHVHQDHLRGIPDQSNSTPLDPTLAMSVPDTLLHRPASYKLDTGSAPK